MFQFGDKVVVHFSEVDPQIDGLFFATYICQDKEFPKAIWALVEDHKYKEVVGERVKEKHLDTIFADLPEETKKELLGKRVNCFSKTEYYIKASELSELSELINENM